MYHPAVLGPATFRDRFTTGEPLCPDQEAEIFARQLYAYYIKGGSTDALVLKSGPVKRAMEEYQNNLKETVGIANFDNALKQFDEFVNLEHLDPHYSGVVKAKEAYAAYLQYPYDPELYTSAHESFEKIFGVMPSDQQHWKILEAFVPETMDQQERAKNNIALIASVLEDPIFLGCRIREPVYITTLPAGLYIMDSCFYDKLCLIRVNNANKSKVVQSRGLPVLQGLCEAFERNMQAALAIYPDTTDITRDWLTTNPLIDKYDPQQEDDAENKVHFSQVIETFCFIASSIICAWAAPRAFDPKPKFEEENRDDLISLYYPSMGFSIVLMLYAAYINRKQIRDVFRNISSHAQEIPVQDVSLIENPQVAVSGPPHWLKKIVPDQDDNQLKQTNSSSHRR